MVAGLATLQDGHACGGEQHSENSDTEHSHTRVGQAALVVVLLAVGHAGLLGAGPSGRPRAWSPARRPVLRWRWHRRTQPGQRQ